MARFPDFIDLRTASKHRITHFHKFRIIYYVLVYQMFRLHSTEVLREHRVKAKDIPVHLVKDGDAR